jgi:hypothetical protein
VRAATLSSLSARVYTVTDAPSALQVLGHGLAAKVAKKALTEVTGEGHVVTAYTWGIGGPRVGRPSHSQPTPAMPVEGIAPGDAVVDVSLSGHTALVTASGVLHPTAPPSTSPFACVRCNAQSTADDGTCTVSERMRAVGRLSSTPRLIGRGAMCTAGVLYTCGRNDSAGGGGHGSPPISDAGQLGRMGPANQLLPVHGELEGKQAVASACGRCAAFHRP